MWPVGAGPDVWRVDRGPSTGLFPCCVRVVGTEGGGRAPQASQPQEPPWAGPIWAVTETHSMPLEGPARVQVRQEALGVAPVRAWTQPASSQAHSLVWPSPLPTHTVHPPPGPAWTLALPLLWRPACSTQASPHGASASSVSSPTAAPFRCSSQRLGRHTAVGPARCPRGESPVSFLSQLERGDFLSEEWRERIANTRYGQCGHGHPRAWGIHPLFYAGHLGLGHCPPRPV